MSVSRRKALKSIAAASAGFAVAPAVIRAQTRSIVIAGTPAEIAIGTVSASTVRITVKPIVNGIATNVVNRGALVSEADARVASGNLIVRTAQQGTATILTIATREGRYRLIAREGCDTGLPMMRALWLHHPDDARAVVTGDQFLWGRDMLVSPVVQKGAASRRVYLPRGSWFDFWTEEPIAGGREIEPSTSQPCRCTCARACVRRPAARSTCESRDRSPRNA